MHSFTSHPHTEPGHSATEPQTHGLVMNWGWRYDLFVWLADKLLLRGKLKELRYRTLEVAQLQKGEAVLDVGCGTGTLALLAKERVGSYGSGIWN